ncbi:hypothetical protein [Brucella canis]|uniref:hypothetical protein n=1 Tax=Brucella canis TaxID=36855 RepID=UPI00039BD396|nr:hypothetical protein [Brucella canis]AOG39031.1 hypothetical protein BFS09_11635 [Brucella canis]KMW07412.1 hypothetical protein AC580_03850 [Brucella canis]CDL77889.1 unnamed protein product [Brucella canis str. Oliveri]
MQHPWEASGANVIFARMKNYKAYWQEEQIMQFLNDYAAFIDVVALLCHIILAVAGAIRQKSIGLIILAFAVTFWALVRFFKLI